LEIPSTLLPTGLKFGLDFGYEKVDVTNSFYVLIRSWTEVKVWS